MESSIALDDFVKLDDSSITPPKNNTPNPLHPATTESSEKVDQYSNEEDDDVTCGELSYECGKCCCKCLIYNLMIDRIFARACNHKTDKNKEQ